MFILHATLAAILAATFPPQEPRPLRDEERSHSVIEGPLRATMLWRSERGLDRSAVQLMEVLRAVDAAGTPRAAASGPDGELVELLLGQNPAQLGRQAGRKGSKLLWASDFRGTGSPALAIAPRLNDRVLFGTGLPPATRRIAALSAARRLAPVPSESVPAWLVEGMASVRAQRGLESIGHARALAVEPWSASGLVELKQHLSAVPQGGRPSELLGLASGPVPDQGLFDPAAPSRQSAAAAARHLLALAHGAAAEGERDLDSLAAAALDRLQGLRPRWVVEGGAVAGHPDGWMVTATQASDALVLEAAPAITGAFRVEATVVIFANDPKFSGQADIVLGDQGGDRLLLAVNTREGVYLFRRAGPGEPYEIVTEVEKFRPPAFSEIPIVIDHDGEVLQVTVGDVKLAPVRLADRSLDGAAGFGAHAGSTVFVTRFKRSAQR